MMRKYILLLITLVVLTACQSIIPIPKMADVLLDVSLAMNYTQQQIVSQKITDTNTIKLMQKKALDTVCAIHHISPQELKNNFNYYTNRPTKMQVILDSINLMSNRLLSSPLQKIDSSKK